MAHEDLNRKIMEGEWLDLILLNEALQEKKSAAIADDIIRRKRRIFSSQDLLLPGKTTLRSVCVSS